MKKEEYMDAKSKILVLGASGLVGSAIVRELHKQGYQNIIQHDSKKCNLKNQIETRRYITQKNPEYVFMCAGLVGGIQANNSQPTSFLYDNAMMGLNVIHECYTQGVEKLLYFGSSCIYSTNVIQPMKENSLLQGPLEPTNQWYAISKILSLKYVEALRKEYNSKFISCMPTNLYGPNDNYDLNSAHVLPALLRKIYLAKLNNQPDYIIWGTGKPKREFLHSDDLAKAAIKIMLEYDSDETINIGSGEEHTIRELAEIIANVIDYKGNIIFDDTKPDGIMRKLVDSSKLKALGWCPLIHLKQGIESAVLNMIDELSGIKQI